MPTISGRLHLLAAALIGCLIGGIVPALADGGNSDKTCPPGEVYDSRAMRCVKQTGALPDKILTDNAIALAKVGRYAEGLALLDRLKDPDTAVALNYRGYITRQMGDLDQGIAYYLKSVALDPHYARVREYLGEAYVLKGDLANARAQLHAIKGICGTGCTAYQHLVKAIADGPDACGSRYAAKRCAS